MTIREKHEDLLARIDTGGVIKPIDWDVIREALERQIGRPMFVQLDDWEWSIGSRRYQNLIGFEHLHKLLSHPGEKIHVCDMTHRPNLENARKATQKAINRAVGALIGTQSDIGLHLKDNIKTGEHCVYLGTWDWQLAP